MRLLPPLLPLAFAALLPLSAQAAANDDAVEAFVTANVISTFYHELGHALIHVLDVPVLGREEDAADSLSALLIHQIWEEESAQSLMADTALAFELYHAESEAGGYEIPYWDEHSLNLQRYFNLVCLFYGADPDNRGFVVTDFELPEDRAERCPDEFAQTERAWMEPLSKAALAQGKPGLVIKGNSSDPLVTVLASEVADFNQYYSLPTPITVAVESCGEANAFYYPDDQAITICTEYADDLRRIWQEQVAE
jgi:hypothetical protein